MLKMQTNLVWVLKRQCPYLIIGSTTEISTLFSVWAYTFNFQHPLNNFQQSMHIFCRVLKIERAFKFFSTLMKFHYDAIQFCHLLLPLTSLIISTHFKSLLEKLHICSTRLSPTTPRAHSSTPLDQEQFLSPNSIYLPSLLWMPGFK